MEGRGVVGNYPPPLSRQKAKKNQRSPITTRTVISTRTRVITTRKLQFPPAECDFHSRVLILLSVITTRSSVIYTRRV
jgi:hypothetical protein